jgi:hypothetical protein
VLADIPHTSLPPHRHSTLHPPLHAHPALPQDPIKDSARLHLIHDGTGDVQVTRRYAPAMHRRDTSARARLVTAGHLTLADLLRAHVRSPRARALRELPPRHGRKAARRR